MTTEVEKVTDSFAYSNGVLETVSSARWQALMPGSSDLSVSGGAVVFAGGARVTSRDTSGSGWTAEQWAECVLTISAGTDRLGVIVRASADEDGSRDYYYVYFDDFVNELKFGKVVNGTDTALGAAESASYTSGDIIKLYAETSGGDTILTAFKNGASVTTRTDSPTSIAGGSSDRCGLMMDASFGSSIDTWRAGILTGADVTLGVDGSASTAAQTAPSINFSVPL
jgi:hypothetical protein